ncbi:TetR family transcriptional regulator C-terminal domain-containing protein [Streptomyces vinaceus]|uniref:TetR family transcriptional regulator C-terminal domain-containing protein n=1 Tax=Streptomyces vinaceus TaxID=1960 RepID=UPI0036AB2158
MAGAVCRRADERGLEGVTLRDVAARAQARSAAALGHAATDVSLLGAEHRAEARVWPAFVAQAAVSEPLAGALRVNYGALEEPFARLVAEAAQDAGLAGAALDPRREARALPDLADGLTARVLVGHLTPEGAQEVLRAHLGRLWTHSG